MRKPTSYWPRIAMNSNLEDGYKSAYTKYLLKWKTDTKSTLLSPKLIRQSVNTAAHAYILGEQRACSTTTFAMNAPDHLQSNNIWFKPKVWVNDSVRTRIFSIFRSCNAGLGNRQPTKDGRFFKLCPLCALNGVNAINNEVRIVQYEPSITLPYRCTW